MSRGRREMGLRRRRGFRRSEDGNVDEVEVEGVMIPCYDMRKSLSSSSKSPSNGNDRGIETQKIDEAWPIRADTSP